MIGLIFAFFGFLLSPVGLFALLSGVLVFILAPVVPLITGVGKPLRNLHLWFSMWSIKRAAIVLSEHNDLLWKRMEFDDLGVEQITFGTDTKEFEDPAARLHHWLGFPFALADEVHGVLFDPRDPAVGAREHDAEERNEMHVRATDEEADLFGVYGWIRGVFELPKGKHELVDLSKVRQLMVGTERAEYPERVQTMYKNSRKPYADKTPISRIAMPVIAFLAVFGGMWLIASQGGSGGGGGGSTVSYGWLLLTGGSAAAADQLREVAEDVDWWYVGRFAAVATPLPLLFLLIVLVAGPLTGIITAVVFCMGLLAMPFLTLVGRVSNTIGGGLSKLYLRLGLLGYREPVFEWTERGYQVREREELSEVHSVEWFSLAGTRVGFTFPPGTKAWGNEVMERKDLKNRQLALTDGGEGNAAAPTNLPAGHSRYPDVQRASVYAAYVPSDIRRGKVYLHSGIALSRFTTAAIGEKSLRKLLHAKEKFGEGGWGLTDKTVLYMTMGAAIIAGLLGVFVFFL